MKMIFNKSKQEKRFGFPFFASALALSTLFSSLPALALTKITRVEFFGKSSPNQIVVVGDGPIEFVKTENVADKQVVFEIKNAKLATSNAARRLDTASFNSKVTLISPYNVAGKDAVRIIVQMREFGNLSTLAEGSRLYVGIDGSADPNILPPETTRSQVAHSGEKSASGSTIGTANSPRGAKNAAKDTVISTTSATEELSATPEGRIQQFLDASQTKRYVGRHITLQVKEADIVDVFKLIGETSGFNMVIGSDVTGKVTLSLVDVPWDLALDTILTTNKLGAERTGNVLRIALLATLTTEKTAQLAAKVAAENSAPRITRIFPLSYATGASLLPVLSRFGAGTAGAITGGATTRDTIIVDERTNALIIQDTADNLERMAKIIKLLDRQTPQVQIEAKIIDASEDFAKAMSGSFGIANQPPWGGVGGSFLQGKTLSPVELPGNVASAKGSNSLGMTLKIGALASTRLSALLSLEESEGRNRVISAPRTVVLNKQSSTIVQGQPVLVPTIVQNPANGSSIESIDVKSANLSLGVTPTVTNDGNIVMTLNVTNDTPQDLAGGRTGIANRNITTQVVAESGSTIAIGGVYTATESDTAAGIPGLRKLPIIGALFGSETRKTNRRELFIFVTPRILNEEVMATDLEEPAKTQQSSALRSQSAALLKD